MLCGERKGFHLLYTANYSAYEHMAEVILVLNGSSAVKAFTCKIIEDSPKS